MDESKLVLKPLGINTYHEPVIYLREDCHVCKSEGIEAQTRVRVILQDRSVIATVNTVQTDVLRHNEASLSTFAWDFLKAMPGDEITITHPRSIDSLDFIRSKTYGNELTTVQINAIIEDLTEGRLSDIQVAMFLTASAGSRFNRRETLDLTRAMVNTGKTLVWPSDLIVDKHCVGGLPGNRTTLIIVPIVAAFGLMIPKTSSRAITSPAGTADTMEVFAPVNLDMKSMRAVVEKENGCVVSGGSMALSPADDLLIRIERSMNLDSEGQLVASILSKKIAAGSNHLVIDIPVGKTAKVHSLKDARTIKNILETTAQAFSIHTAVVISDGSQPVGRGVGPALEAQDVLQVLSNHPGAPSDLRERALILAGHILEFSPTVKKGNGKAIAESLLKSGQALQKFEAICRAQGGFNDIPKAKYTHVVESEKYGRIIAIDNGHVARVAKLAGAPSNKAAGVELFAKVGQVVEKSQPLFTIHAEAKGELDYAISFLRQGHVVFDIEG